MLDQRGRGERPFVHHIDTPSHLAKVGCMDDKVILEEEGLELQTLQDNAYTLWEDLTHWSLRGKVAHQLEAELLLRVVIALLNEQNGADLYIQAKLRSAVGGLGFDLQIIPKEKCQRGSECPHHDHSDDIVYQWSRRRREANKRERKQES